MAEPILSVIIPTYNRAAILRNTLAALRNVKDIALEACISDNASTDATPEVIAEFQTSFPVRAIRQQQHLSLAANHQAACRVAGAPYAIIIGDEDRLVEASLASALKRLDETPHLSAVYGSFDIRDIHTKEHVARRSCVSTERIYKYTDIVELLNHVFMMECVLFRTEILQMKFVHSGRRHPCGWHLLTILLAAGDILAIPDTLVIKYDSPGRYGYRIYESWFQDLMYNDFEIFSLKAMKMTDTSALRIMALRKICQLNFTSSSAAADHKSFDTAVHYLQCLSALPPLYPAEIDRGELVIQCAAERLLILLNDCGAARLVVEEREPILQIVERVRDLMPSLAVVRSTSPALDATGDDFQFIYQFQAGTSLPLNRQAALTDLISDIRWLMEQ